jgi:D-glycero-D-manno-heptose 1,7-bisphosphate phosphatase
MSHLPQASVAAYRVDCECRKPRPGMIVRACAQLGLDPAASCLFGDKPSDITAGRAAGGRRTRLIAPSRRGEPRDAGRGPVPDGIHANLLDAVRAELAIACGAGAS